jgi:hypothetical protein
MPTPFFHGSDFPVFSHLLSFEMAFCSLADEYPCFCLLPRWRLRYLLCGIFYVSHLVFPDGKCFSELEGEYISPRSGQCRSSGTSPRGYRIIHLMDNGDRIGGEFLLRSAVRHSVEAYYGCYTGLFPFSLEEASHNLNCIAQRCLAFYHDYCTYYLLIPQFSVQTHQLHTSVWIRHDLRLASGKIILTYIIHVPS